MHAMRFILMLALLLLATSACANAPPGEYLPADQTIELSDSTTPVLAEVGSKADTLSDAVEFFVQGGITARQDWYVRTLRQEITITTIQTVHYATSFVLLSPQPLHDLRERQLPVTT